jgi:hypothetical protein
MEILEACERKSKACLEILRQALSRRRVTIDVPRLERQEQPEGLSLGFPQIVAMAVRRGYVPGSILHTDSAANTAARSGQPALGFPSHSRSQMRLRAP